MQLKKLKMLLIVLSLVTGCSSGLKVRKAPAILENPPSRSLAQSESCEEVLEKCTKAVDAQKKAIKEQQDVIDKQKEVIEHAEKEVERAHKATNTAITGGVSVSTILLLLLLL